MNETNQIDTTSTTMNLPEKRRDVRIVDLLFNATTLGAAVVAAAIVGPKVPPLAGD